MTGPSEGDGMTEQALTRLAELQREYEVGQRRLQELMAQEVVIRETLLRISGAIQVLEELTGRATSTQGGAPLPEPPAVPAQDAEPTAPGTALQVG
jgi:hypothetical protein